MKWIRPSRLNTLQPGEEIHFGNRVYATTPWYFSVPPIIPSPLSVASDEVRWQDVAWLIGKPYDADKLPEKVRAYEVFKRDPSRTLPDLPFQYYTSKPLTSSHWKAVATRASWQSLRQNLNHFARHGVFTDAYVLRKVVAKLTDVALKAGLLDVPEKMADPMANSAALWNTTEPGRTIRNIPAIPASTSAIRGRVIFSPRNTTARMITRIGVP